MFLVLPRDAFRYLPDSKDVCRIEKSLVLATVLAPRTGYNEAARIARKAYEQHKTIRQAVEEEGLFPEKELNCLLDFRTMIAPMKMTKRRKREASRRLRMIWRSLQVR